MPRLLQEALWLRLAGQEDRAHSEDEGRQVVLVDSDRGPGSPKGPGPDRESVAPSRFHRTNVQTGINVSELFDTKRLELCTPEQRKINSPGERFYGQLNRLANDSRREKTERNEPPHRATVDSFPSCQVADRTHFA